MKRIFAIVAAIILMSGICVNANAAPTENVPSETILYEDGSYLVIELEESMTRAAGSKTGSKTYTYNSSSGEVLWKAVLSGTFTYTGASATCTASSCNVTIYNSAWSVASKSVSKSANKAIAQLVMGKKLLGITVGNKEVYMTLACDGNGNLS